MSQEIKVALITGGTSGIGLATAQVFLANGYRVCVSGRSEAKGRAALALLEGGENAIFARGDVRVPSGCKCIVDEAATRFGCVDVLVNSAGVYFEQSIEDTSEDEFSMVMDTNIKGTYFMCKYVIPYLKQRTSSSVVNVSSDAGINGNFFCTAYCASKGAVTVFSKALALELAPYGVRVNCVCPGDIDTPLTAAQFKNEQTRAQEINALKQLYPIGRIGTAEEVAEVIYFLASPKASFMTGAAMSVDGGITAY